MRSRGGSTTPVNNDSKSYSTVFDKLHDYKSLTGKSSPQTHKPLRIFAFFYGAGPTAPAGRSPHLTHFCTAGSVFPTSIQALPVMPGGSFGNQQQHNDP